MYQSFLVPTQSAGKVVTHCCSSCVPPRSYQSVCTKHEIAAAVVAKKRITPRHPFFHVIRIVTLNGSGIYGSCSPGWEPRHSPNMRFPSDELSACKSLCTTCTINDSGPNRLACHASPRRVAAMLHPPKLSPFGWDSSTP